MSELNKNSRSHVNSSHSGPATPNSQNKMLVQKPTEYPNELTIDDFEDYFGNYILQYVDEELHSDGLSDIELIADDPVVRYKHAVDFAKKHDAQIYTYVDLDSGEIGYSKGVRYANRINQGEYVIVKIPGLEADNS